MGLAGSWCRIVALQGLAHSFLVYLSFEAWLMSPIATGSACGCCGTEQAPHTDPGVTVSARPAGGFLPRQRLQVRALVGQRAAIGLGLPGHELRTGRHLGVGLIFGITATVETDGGAHDPGEQVETDGLSFRQVPPDGEVVPLDRVADVLERVLVLVGPEVVDVVKR